MKRGERFFFDFVVLFSRIFDKLAVPFYFAAWSWLCCDTPIMAGVIRCALQHQSWSFVVLLVDLCESAAAFQLLLDIEPRMIEFAPTRMLLRSATIEAAFDAHRNQAA